MAYLRLLVVVHDLEEDPRDELAVVLDQVRRHLRRARHPLKLKRMKQGWFEEWLLGCALRGEVIFTQPARLFMDAMNLDPKHLQGCSKRRSPGCVKKR